MADKRNALIGISIFILLLLFPFYVQDNYYMHIAILFFMYTIVSTGWNIIGGYTGQVSFGHNVFFAIGAYTSSILSIKFGISPWIGMVAGMVMSGMIAILIGIPFFRLTGHYFAIATLALAGIASAVGLNWEFIGGSVGIYLPIKEDSFWQMQFGAEKYQYFYIVFGLATFSVLFSYWLSKTKSGYYFRAIRENGDAAASIGINTLKYKLLAFVYSAMIVSIGGTFYAQYFLYINPEGVLNSDISIQMVLMTVLGGVGTVIGPIIGAAFLVPVSELIRGYLGGTSTGIDQMIYALIIILVATLQPAGIIGFIHQNVRGSRVWFISRRKRKKDGEIRV